MSRASSQPLTNPAAMRSPSGVDVSVAIRRSASTRSSMGRSSLEAGDHGYLLVPMGDGTCRLGLVGREAAGAEVERTRLQTDSFVVVLASLDGVPEVNRTRGYASGDAVTRPAEHADEVIARAHASLGAEASAERA